MAKCDAMSVRRFTLEHSVNLKTIGSGCAASCNVSGLLMQMIREFGRDMFFMAMHLGFYVQDTVRLRGQV